MQIIGIAPGVWSLYVIVMVMVMIHDAGYVMCSATLSTLMFEIFLWRTLEEAYLLLPMGVQRAQQANI